MDTTQLKEKLKDQLSEIHQRGYIVSLRKGDTGVGHTLEHLLGVKENNLSVPDLGNIEVKGRRIGTNSLATMFTRNAWKIHPKELIDRYGYKNGKGRLALKSTVKSKPNNRGFYVKVEQDAVRAYHEDGPIAAEWQSEVLIARLKKKMPNVLLGYADRRRNSEGKEEFWYKDADLLTGLNVDNFYELIKKGIIAIDFRIHLEENGSVRDRGTAFRFYPKYWYSCFNNSEKLL